MRAVSNVDFEVCQKRTEVVTSEGLKYAMPGDYILQKSEDDYDKNKIILTEAEFYLLYDIVEDMPVNEGDKYEGLSENNTQDITITTE
jgi:hypothetical protein